MKMQMKSLLAALALSTAMIVPAQAKNVTLSTTLTPYNGQGAYLAIYVTDASGAYAGSLWMAGGKTKYYKHLTDWARFTGNDSAEVSGITGASVGAGKTLDLSMDLADALFDAGYTLHIDAAVEDLRDSPNEIAVPLTASGAGQAVNGRQYIDSFRYDF